MRIIAAEGSLLAAGDRLLDHGFVDREHARAGVGGIEFETADDAAEGLAQRAGAEALLARGVPGDGDQRAARDLQVDAEALEVRARRAEDRRSGSTKMRARSASPRSLRTTIDSKRETNCGVMP